MDKVFMAGSLSQLVSPQEETKKNPLESLATPEVRQQVLMSLTVLFCELGLEPQVAEDLVGELNDLVVSDFNEEVFVAAARTKMEQRGLYKLDAEFAQLFTAWKYKRLKPYLGKRVLDVGAGSGAVGKMIASESGSEVTLVDVADFNKTDLPCLIYDGATLPVEAESQDTVLLLCSLHHSLQPLKVLQEAKRVTSDRTLILEPVYLDNNVDKQRALFVDWFVARVLHESGMDFAGNLHSVSEWKRIFDESGFDIEVSEDGFDPTRKESDIFASRAISERTAFFVLKKRHE